MSSVPSSLYRHSLGVDWGRFSILFIMLSSIRLSLLVWFWFMSHVSDPYVIIGIMHDSIRGPDHAGA